MLLFTPTCLSVANIGSSQTPATTLFETKNVAMAKKLNARRNKQNTAYSFNIIPVCILLCITLCENDRITVTTTKILGSIFL
jgi:hypothetical protein